jgi:hypothetical protein
MAGELETLLKRLENDDDQAEGIFSLFDKWFNEEECSAALMSYCDVGSFEEYDRIKEIERQYLRLVVDLSIAYEVRLICSYSTMPENKLATFNDLYSAVSRHVNQDKQFGMYLRDIGTLVHYGHDFTLLIYVTEGGELQRVREIFLRNGFHQLP